MDSGSSRISSDAIYARGDIIAGKYELIRLLGEGGMGSVWVCKNLALEVEVALKLIKRDSSSEAPLRLLTEARAAARLCHASIVKIYDFGRTERDEPFIVMELLAGDTLAALIDDRGRLGAMEAVRTLLPVAGGLAAAHEQGVIHRDMKPDNVMLVRQPGGIVVPKIVDFGIAKVHHDEPRRRATTVGTVLGSPDYMSPEQARGRDDVDERCDVWALAVVLYEMISGRRPFRGANYNAVITAVILEEPTPTTEFAAGDATLWGIIRRGLEKERDDRFTSIHAMGLSLAHWAVERGAETDVAGVSIRTQWLGECTDPSLFRHAIAPPVGSVRADDESVAPTMIEPSRRPAEVTRVSTPGHVGDRRSSKVAVSVETRASKLSPRRPGLSPRHRLAWLGALALAVCAIGFTAFGRPSWQPPVRSAAEPQPSSEALVIAPKPAPAPSQPPAIAGSASAPSASASAPASASAAPKTRRAPASSSKPVVPSNMPVPRSPNF